MSEADCAYVAVCVLVVLNCFKHVKNTYILNIQVPTTFFGQILTFYYLNTTLPFLSRGSHHPELGAYQIHTVTLAM